jgi:membrane-associated protein
VAANCGDALNYFLGRTIGPKVFSREDSWMLNKKHLLEAHQFYEKHGRKTIILARFVPIVRTFAPFVAGIGKMNFLNFAAFSIAGGAMWVSVCLIAGYKLARVEFVQKHFQLMVLAIIFVSILPMIIHAVQARRRRGGATMDAISSGSQE